MAIRPLFTKNKNAPAKSKNGSRVIRVNKTENFLITEESSIDFSFMGFCIFLYGLSDIIQTPSLKSIY
jgi:hypothetical protein